MDTDIIKNNQPWYKGNEDYEKRRRKEKEQQGKPTWTLSEPEGQEDFSVGQLN